MGFLSSALLTLGFVTHLSTAAPWPSEPLPKNLEGRQSPPSVANAAGLAGINWFYAQSECHPVQLSNLQQAFVDVAQLGYATIPAPHGDNPSFMAYFGVGYVGKVYEAKFWKIFENIRKASDFPYYGAGDRSERNRISVHCKDIQSRCSNNPWNPRYNVLAYTGASPNQPGPYMVFCDRFWNKAFPHLRERVNGRKSHAADDCITQEHVVLHELMHADVAGFTEHIEDISTTLPGETDNPDIPGGISNVVVYGPNRCKKLAAKKSPPLQALKNADNYAWFATSKYFSDAWGFTVTQGEGFVEGSTDPIPPFYTQPNNGDVYGDWPTSEAEWTT